MSDPPPFAEVAEPHMSLYRASAAKQRGEQCEEGQKLRHLCSMSGSSASTPQ